MPKPYNIAMIGYGFMGRAHSNAYANVSHYFNLEYKPVLKAVCARDKDKAQAFANQWGYESVETDWKKLLAARTSMPSISVRRTTSTRRLGSRQPRPARPSCARSLWR